MARPPLPLIAAARLRWGRCGARSLDCPARAPRGHPCRQGPLVACMRRGGARAGRDCGQRHRRLSRFRAPRLGRLSSLHVYEAAAGLQVRRRLRLLPRGRERRHERGAGAPLQGEARQGEEGLGEGGGGAEARPAPLRERRFLLAAGCGAGPEGACGGDAAVFEGGLRRVGSVRPARALRGFDGDTGCHRHRRRAPRTEVGGSGHHTRSLRGRSCCQQQRHDYRPLAWSSGLPIGGALEGGSRPNMACYPLSGS
mmetsp:Transcript_111751/g.312370  ORF Transcript_111751/g.312370 Transcript_111751/m.312370 type:complete len:254 (-) Transcript_111751:196-957(-)